MAGSILLGGCLAKSTTPLQPDSRYGPRQLTILAPAALGSRPAPPPVRFEPESESEAYSCFRFELASSGDNRQPRRLIRGRYFRSRQGGARPLIVILPIWGASGYPPSAVARELTRGDHAGAFHVLRLEGSEPLVDWRALELVQSEAAFRAEIQRGIETHLTAVEDIRRLVDWAVHQPEIDRSRIGLTGFSMSAIIGSLVIGLEPRIWRSTLVMGGARPAEIFASCTGRVRRVRRALQYRFGWSEEEFRRRLEPMLRPIDPARYGGRVDPRRVLIIDAEWDRCIPRASRTALWSALGRPERVRISGGHHWAFLSMTPLDGRWTTRRIGDFFASPEPTVSTRPTLGTS